MIYELLVLSVPHKLFYLYQIISYIFRFWYAKISFLISCTWASFSTIVHLIFSVSTKHSVSIATIFRTIIYVVRCANGLLSICGCDVFSHLTAVVQSMFSNSFSFSVFTSLLFFSILFYSIPPAHVFAHRLSNHFVKIHITNDSISLSPQQQRKSEKTEITTHRTWFPEWHWKLNKFIFYSHTVTTAVSPPSRITQLSIRFEAEFTVWDDGYKWPHKLQIFQAQTIRIWFCDEVHRLWIMMHREHAHYK